MIRNNSVFVLLAQTSTKKNDEIDGFVSDIQGCSDEWQRDRTLKRLITIVEPWPVSIQSFALEIP